MIRRPPRSTRTDTLFPYTTLFRSFGRIAGDGLSLAKAPGGNPRRLNPIHAEVIGNGLGAAFAQRLVVHVGAGAVGMAVNVDIGARIILQHFGYVRSEEHTSELQSLMRISYAVFCLKKNHHHVHNPHIEDTHESTHVNN